MLAMTLNIDLQWVVQVNDVVCAHSMAHNFVNGMGSADCCVQHETHVTS